MNHVVCLSPNCGLWTVRRIGSELGPNFCMGIPLCKEGIAWWVSRLADSAVSFARTISPQNRCCTIMRHAQQFGGPNRYSTTNFTHPQLHIFVVDYTAVYPRFSFLSHSKITIVAGETTIS